MGSREGMVLALEDRGQLITPIMHRDVKVREGIFWELSGVAFFLALYSEVEGRCSYTISSGEPAVLEEIYFLY